MSGKKLEFEAWLRKKLIECQTDEEVFGPYILGILEGDETEEEQKESLEGILSGMMETNIEEFCKEIMEQWLSSKPDKELVKTNEKPVETLDLNDKFNKLLESNKQESNKPAQPISEEQKKIKEAILAQYSQVSDEDEDDDDEEDIPAPANANLEAVAQAEKQRRESEKEASHKKKEKDKEDRAKQKAKQDERKEKEKKRTQKGERRR